MGTVSTGRYRWYVLTVLVAAQTCHTIDRTIISLVLEPVKLEFGLSDQQLGILAGVAYGIAFGLSTIPLGMAVDRLNRRALLAAVVSLWSAFTVLCGFAGSFIALLLSRSAVGAAEAGGAPSSVSLLSDYFGPSERSSAVSIWYMSTGLGAAISFIFGAHVVQNYGWRMGFIMAGLPGLLVAAILFFTVREPSRGAAETGPLVDAVGTLKQRVKQLVGRAGLIHCGLGITLAAISAASASAWVASFFIRSHGLSLTQAGMIAAISFGIFGPVGGLITGLLVDRVNSRLGFDPARPAIFSTVTPLLAAVFGITAVLQPALAPALVLFVIYTIFQNAHNGSANGLLATLAGPHMRGTALGALQVGTNLAGYGMGPLLVGFFSQRLGVTNSLGWSLAIALCFNFWASAHFFLAARRIKAGQTA
jgi:MFS family permease